MMTPARPTHEAVEALRKAAAELSKRADELEQGLSEAESRIEPLAPAGSDDEAAARLIALEGSSSGRDRSEVIAQIKAEYPSADAESLVARFYG